MQLVEKNKWFDFTISEKSDKKTKNESTADTARKEAFFEKNEFDQTGTWSE